ncbi:MAG TPA: serine hydrolase [Thermoanaerobaculia bacterium]|jgi:CubicO group peptidase (beta-lactamase class C family)
MRPLAVLLSLVLSLPVCAQALDTRAAERAVNATLKAWQLPGLAVAIVQNDRVVFLSGYGVKDLSTGERVTPDTLFQIASTSKAFTTTALAMLVDEKKLQWDDRVRDHLEYFRLADACADANVTIRDIVSHRTGVAEHDELWDNSPWSREEVVRKIGKVELSQPFRSGYHYNNIMFIAAGEVIARAAGMPWDEFVHARLFAPLQMTHTVTTDAQWNASDHATGYRYDAAKDRITPQPPIDTTTIGSGGAIKSSARDLANWLRFQLGQGEFNGQRLVSAEALAETKMPQTVIRLEGATRDAHPESNLYAYAMGWYVQDYRGELLVSHTGSLNGFRTNTNLLPRRNSGFVLLTNAGRSRALLALRNTLADLLSGKPGRDWNAYYLMLDRKAADQANKARDERAARRVPNTNPSHPLEAYTGTYRNEAYGSATVKLVNGALVVQWSRMTLPLTHFHYDTFTAYSEADDVDEEVTFGIGERGEVKTLTIFGERFVKE